jgi:two-component system NtrC family response regulator
MSSPSSECEPCVLIVDATEQTRTTLAQTLASEGYLVLTAASGRDALGILSKPLSAIDVIVLDPRLPHMAAVDFCSRLRENHPRMPIIVCASEPNPQEDARLIGLGARRYFLKPITPDELLAAVEAVLPR